MLALHADFSLEPAYTTEPQRGLHRVHPGVATIGSDHIEPTLWSAMVGFRKSVYERSRNRKECCEGSQSENASQVLPSANLSNAPMAEFYNVSPCSVREHETNCEVISRTHDTFNEVRGHEFTMYGVYSVPEYVKET